MPKNVNLQQFKKLLSEYRVPAVLVGAFILVYLFYTVFSGGASKEELLTLAKAPFVQQVSVSGKVIAGDEVDMGFSQSGRISRVYVTEGDVVSAGAVIAEIENGDSYALLQSRQAARDREQANLDSLIAGTRPESIAIAEAAVRSADTSVRAAQQALLDAASDAFSKSDAAVHTNADQLFSNPNSSLASLNVVLTNGNQRTAIEGLRTQLEPVFATWEGDTSDAKAQLNIQKVNTFLNTLAGGLESAQASQSVTQAQLDAYKASISAARASVNLAQSALTAAQRGYTSAVSAREAAERDLTLKRAGATPQEIRAQEANVKSAQADVLSAQSQVAKTQIRAPFRGTISKLDAKVGKIVSPNTPEVTLIGTGAFEIESFIPEINVGLISVDDEAVVTLDAILEETFTAKVASIDIGESLRDGVSTYRTLLEFASTDERIRSGMTANVEIITEKKENVLSVPFKLVKGVPGKQTVTVKVDDEYVEKSVTTGAVSSLGTVEILTGLKVGDQVVVVPRE